MFDLILDRCCKVFEAAIAFCLALMVVLVFGNVFLRYAMNSGITLSEELSRWAFVWMTFLGAIVALKEHGHLGTDMLVSRLGPFGKKICLGASYSLMLFACWLLFKGAYEQAVINLGSTSAVMEASMAWIYLPGILFAVMGGLILSVEFIRLLTGQVRDENLVMIQDSEEAPHGNSH